MKLDEMLSSVDKELNLAEMKAMVSRLVSKDYDPFQFAHKSINMEVSAPGGGIHVGAEIRRFDYSESLVFLDHLCFSRIWYFAL